MNDDWQESALCRQITIEQADKMFFRDTATRMGSVQRQRVRDFCGNCEVQIECWLAGSNEEYGVWGGEFEEERFPAGVSS